MLSILKRTFRDFSDDECPVRAAALAYYTVFALPPLLVLLIMLAGALWDPRDVQRAMETQFASLVGRQGAAAIHGMIQSADRPGGGLIASVISIGLLLFGATGAFLQLQGALNRAWEVRPDPEAGGLKNFLMKRLLSLGMILGVAFLMIVSLAISALIGAAGDQLTAIPQPVMYAVNLAVSLAVLTVVFAAIFKVLPDAEIQWRYVWVGAIATAVLFVVGKFAIGLYLGRSAPGDAFGAASALAVILVWVYYAGMIVLFGAEFTQAWANAHGATIRPEQGALRFDRDGRRASRPPERRQSPDDSRDAAPARDAARSRHIPISPRRFHMETAGHRDVRRASVNASPQTHGGDGRAPRQALPALAPDQSIGELFRQLTTDSSHLVRQEIALARTELKDTGARLGRAGAKLGIAAGVALPGVLALTAFLVIGLGDLMNENYWLSALLVGLAFVITAAMLARRARATISERPLGVPDTAGTLREDARWAKQEAQEFRRQFTA